MVARSAVAKPRLADYSDIEPLPDPPRRTDMEQFDGINHFAAILEPRFLREEGYLISGSGYLRMDAEDRGDFVPDITFARGVGDALRIIKRNGYVISEVGKPPDLVLEVASRTTGGRDYTVKREGYARYGVGEYWRFDPSGGEYHDAPLAGDRLVDGRYEPIEIVGESDGRHWGYSDALELEVWWDGGMLRFRDPASGEFLRRPYELQAALDAADARAESERVAREAAERRLAEMEAEARRLRGEAGSE